eukprot:Protomagalhaensia_wolfi_Nauph_80__2110@NODE_2353_length_1119_cov_5_328704_g1843_i0_p1_GENE_NODE_2353_length_1119_cov_5_328704_g1843_i0NODE_2353_length_1119_cov_5_328704_g1843_i0_p1_ORF_typecomplete_len335_score39_94_NODE_2353_length_1119_cov_5_328704_g1843_i01151089
MTRTIVCSAKKPKAEAKHYGLAAALVLTANGGGVPAVAPSEDWILCGHMTSTAQANVVCEILKRLVDLGYTEAKKPLHQAVACLFRPMECLQEVLHDPPCASPDFQSEHAHDLVQRVTNIFLSGAANRTALATGSSSAASPYTLFDDIDQSTQATRLREILQVEDVHRTVPLAENAHAFTDLVLKAITAAGGYVAVQAEEFLRALVVPEARAPAQYDVANSTCLSWSTEYPQHVDHQDGNDPSWLNPLVFTAMMIGSMAIGLVAGIRCTRGAEGGSALGRWLNKPVYQRLPTSVEDGSTEEPLAKPVLSRWGKVNAWNPESEEV